MKNISLYSFLMVLSLLTANNAFAYDLEVDGIYYNLDMDNYTASVTSGDNKYIGDVVIPPKFSYNYKVEFDVVEIEKQAFSSCSGLTSVSIGEGVTAIGSSAFYNCKKLVSVSIPSTVKTIGSSAFYGCI